MKRFWLIILIIVFLVIVSISAVFLVPDSNKNFTHQTNNSTNNSSDEIELTNHAGVTDGNNVTVTANCQITALQGTDAVIVWKVTNNGNRTIKNVKGSDQIGYHDFGEIGPFETKTYRFTTYIPTNKDLKLDFDIENDSWPGPLWIGGFGLSYSLDNVTFNTHANSMEIQVKV